MHTYITCLTHGLSIPPSLLICFCSACRHGDRCSRLHNRPTISPTILLHNLYMNPVLNAPLGPDGLPVPVDPEKVQQFFEDFYEDIFLELDKYGEVEHLCVCDNLADHMVGNVYVKFRDEEGAARALQGMQGRYYAGKPIQVEFSPVTDFRESTCRQYEEGTCKRAGYCNFMHVRPVARSLRKQLFGRYGDGSGGSTRFHDDRRGGGNRYGGDRDRYGGRNRYGNDRRSRDHDRGRDRYAERDRRDDRRQGGGRESSAERRARIAQWNAETTLPPVGAGGAGYGGGMGAGGAPPAAPQMGYQGAAPNGAPPPPPNPAGYAGAYDPVASAAAVGGGGYGAAPQAHQYQQQQQQQQHYGGGGGGGGYNRGGSGANTVPIANMRTFPPPPP
jgi:splicing factor U2AF 35 kDa subunit